MRASHVQICLQFNDECAPAKKSLFLSKSEASLFEVSELGLYHKQLLVALGGLQLM